jgi:hypothetical protein
MSRYIFAYRNIFGSIHDKEDRKDDETQDYGNTKLGTDTCQAFRFMLNRGLIILD